MSRAPGRFWQGFVARNWERQPLALADLAGTPLPAIAPAELFDAVVACGAAQAAGSPQTIRLYVHGNLVDLSGGFQKLLPCRADGSFSGYHRRMTEQLAELGRPDYALIIADWHAFHRVAWERICGALAGLFAAVGISRARMDTQIFLGTYRVTPFGVHVDPTGSFHFPVLGRKTMRLWSGAYAARHPDLPDALRYGRFKAGSRVLTARAGGMLYWPSSAWHVGESGGSFSVTWGLGYWTGDRFVAGGTGASAAAAGAMGAGAGA
ncbi:MAG: hypothetical protein HZA54_12860, partial [Planctomycetes bacterium]|nr:hypothetical protein [Planctomycetota bacterium]